MPQRRLIPLCERATRFRGLRGRSFVVGIIQVSTGDVYANCKVTTVLYRTVGGYL